MSETNTPASTLSSDWPPHTVIIRCRHCGIPLSLIKENDVHGWSHNGGIGAPCPPVMVNGEPQTFHAEPSDYIKAVFQQLLTSETVRQLFTNETIRVPKVSFALGDREQTTHSGVTTVVRPLYYRGRRIGTIDPDYAEELMTALDATLGL